MFGRMLIALAATAALLAAVGCGDDPATPAAAGVAPVTVEVSDTGYAMPDQIAGGVVAMRFRNVGALPHEFALAKVEGDHTAAEALAAVKAFSGQGEPPSWLTDVAGPPLLTAGDEITITRTLEPGLYVAFDAVPDSGGVRGIARGLLKAFTIEGDSGAALPPPNAVITAQKTRYAIPPLSAGTTTIELRNASGEGRGFLLATLNPGKTEADIGRWGESIGTTGRLPAGPVPATFLGAMQTIPSGTSVFITLDLEAGREYALSDDNSGIMGRFTPR